MSSRVQIRNDAEGSVVSIRPRQGRLVSVIALCGLLWFIVNDYRSAHISSGAVLLTFAMTWGVPFILLLLFTAWQFFGKEQIRISDQEIRIDKMIGQLRFGRTRSIAISLIDAVEAREKSYRAKGRSYTSRNIVFLCKGDITARSAQLSKTDSEMILAGPLRSLTADGRPCGPRDSIHVGA